MNHVSENKQRLRQAFRKIRRMFTDQLINKENFLNINSIYKSMQDNLFFVINEKMKFIDKTDINIGLFAPIKDEIDVQSIFYGSEHIRKLNSNFNENLNLEGKNNIKESNEKVFNCDVLQFLDIKESLVEKLKKEMNVKISTSLPSIFENKNMKFYKDSFNYKKGKFNISEVIINEHSGEIIPDIIIVPLLTFDKSLNRIGYGLGHFDLYFTNNNNFFKYSNISNCSKDFQIEKDKKDENNEIFSNTKFKLRPMLKIGIAYDIMYSNELIESDSLDIKLDIVITEKNIYYNTDV